MDAEPSNLEVLDALGALLAEVGPAEEAVSILQRAVELSPEEGHEKYLYLGQILDTEEALGSTEKVRSACQQKCGFLCVAARDGGFWGDDSYTIDRIG